MQWSLVVEFLDETECILEGDGLSIHLSIEGKVTKLSVRKGFAAAKAASMVERV